MHDESFSVAALSCPANVCGDTLATFSSRGPVTVDASNRVKPDIAAPGTNVRSATNSSDTAYASMQGTSMAGPHVAGAVALVLSAVPSLNGNVSGTESRITGNAVRNATNSTNLCSSTTGVYPNNLFGFGRLDAACAVAGAPLSAVSIGVAGSTVIGNPAPCVGGTATATDTGGGPSSHQWGFRTVSGGPITNLAGATGATYALTCSDFPAAGQLPARRAHDAALRRADRLERGRGDRAVDAGRAAALHGRVGGRSGGASQDASPIITKPAQ